MRRCLQTAAFAVGLGLSSIAAAETVASAGETAPDAVPVTTITKQAIGDAKPAAVVPAAVVPAAGDPVEQRTEVERPKPPAPPSLIVKINLSTQRLEVSGGSAHFTWPISSGRAGFESPRGTFRAQWTSRMWYSRKYDMAPMPHAVFFTGGVAIHATSSVGMLGQPASHGCIRLAPANAATFYSLVQKHGLKQTQIQVFGSPPSPRVARTPTRDRGPGTAPVRLAASPFAGPFAGTTPGPRPGAVYLRPGSPYAGAASFEHNGVRYVRMR